MNELAIVTPNSLWHPSAVSARATLFGVPSTPVENASVLELDCGDAGNILSIAASLPGSTCLGISSTADSLARGQALQSAAGLTNLNLQEDSAGIEGVFDYIFLRNTFSRFAPKQRNELMSYYSGKLSENGIMVVDHMCLPGWHFLEPIRQQMVYHTRNLTDPHERMIAGRQYLSALAQSVPSTMEQYRLIAEAELMTSQGVPDLNFGIEYLDTELHPSFFHEFGASLEGNGIQYLCELSLGSMMINQFPAAMGSIMPEDASVMETEQYLDFVTNRNRRTTLLCRDSVEVDRSIEPTACEPLYFSAIGLPDNPEAVFEEEETVLSSPNGGFITLKTPVGKAAMLALAKEFPKRLSLPEVCQAVEEGLGEFGEGDQGIVAETLTACAVSEIVQIDSIPGRATFEVSEHPVASSLVRAQAASEDLPYVATLHHGFVNVDQAAVALLQLLDGNNDKGALVARLREMIDDESLTVQKEGEPTDDAEVIAEASEQQVEAFLFNFARSGLLEA